MHTYVAAHPGPSPSQRLKPVLAVQLFMKTSCIFGVCVYFYGVSQFHLAVLILYRIVLLKI